MIRQEKMFKIDLKVNLKTIKDRLTNSFLKSIGKNIKLKFLKNEVKTDVKRIKKHSYHLLFYLIFLFSPHQQVQAKLNSASIMTATFEALPHCLHYQVTGFCYWWREGLYPHMETTLRVAHYIPDVVVTVYNRVGDNPWLEANIAYDQVSYNTGNVLFRSATSFGLEGGQHSMNHDNDVYFKEVDVIGNPGVKLLLKGSTIPSQAIPFQLYFHSQLDALAWRLGIEMLYPQSWDPLSHNIGHKGFQWGHVYPRDGFVNAANDAMASAVVAQRATDIVTKMGQAHVYSPLSNSCGSHCSASPVQENDNHIQWQLIYPVKEHSCHVFGEAENWGNDISSKTKGNYAWILWRYYEGCIPDQGANYIGEVKW